MTTQFCPNCGAKLAPKNRFCPSCGAAVARTATRPRKKQRPRKKTRRNYRDKRIIAVWTLVAGMILLLIAAVVAFSEQNKPPAALTELQDYHDAEGVPYPDVPRITVTEAKVLYDAGAAIFVDVRSQGEYETAHVANAWSLPMADLEARYQELPKNATIITYCT
ncbi:MAG: zinc-ribbon domain-containing protein [Chloroflexi bacterium]|nr:zinc-ribbon domain-containing protein [Chloroflexota bacterium]